MTVSAPKRILGLAIILIALIAASVFIQFKGGNDSHQLQAGGRTFAVEMADTDAKREMGLSGRTDLLSNQAMLFVFDSGGKRCFWMKDMKFPIDMIWLDASKKVVGQELYVSPGSYPNSFCHDNAQYVVEFSAGTAGGMSLKTGDQFSW